MVNRTQSQILASVVRREVSTDLYLVEILAPNRWKLSSLAVLMPIMALNTTTRPKVMAVAYVTHRWPTQRAMATMVNSASTKDDKVVSTEGQLVVALEVF